VLPPVLAVVLGGGIGRATGAGFFAHAAAVIAVISAATIRTKLLRIIDVLSAS
jgi:hypothetical protein